jgi:RimJ/RimL family protein N-acetyltransferase
VITQHTEYPFELDGELALRDESRLRVRALRRGEADPIVDFYARLSARTRYLRFFHRCRRCPTTCSAGSSASIPVGSDREVVGLGSFHAVGERTAEVALVVRDDWQQRGVGTALATRVLEAAEDRGYDRFVAHLLHENAPIRRILARVAHRLSARTRGGISELVLIRRRPEFVT